MLSITTCEIDRRLYGPQLMLVPELDVAETGGRWQMKGPTGAGNRQFAVADPDGYLWRPFRDLGLRPATE